MSPLVVELELERERKLERKRKLNPHFATKANEYMSP